MLSWPLATPREPLYPSKGSRDVPHLGWSLFLGQHQAQALVPPHFLLSLNLMLKAPRSGLLPFLGNHALPSLFPDQQGNQPGLWSQGEVHWQNLGRCRWCSETGTVFHLSGNRLWKFEVTELFCRNRNRNFSRPFYYTEPRPPSSPRPRLPVCARPLPPASLSALSRLVVLPSRLFVPLFGYSSSLLISF